MVSNSNKVEAIPEADVKETVNCPVSSVSPSLVVS
jgi:hypothetical protein